MPVKIKPRPRSTLMPILVALGAPFSRSAALRAALPIQVVDQRGIPVRDAVGGRRPRRRRLANRWCGTLKPEPSTRGKVGRPVCQGQAQ